MFDHSSLLTLRGIHRKQTESLTILLVLQFGCPSLSSHLLLLLYTFNHEYQSTRNHTGA